MPPNVHQVEPEARTASYENHFWALDRSGMDNLFGYVKSALDDLDTIYTVYIKRAEIEQEYGQKLQELSAFTKQNQVDYSGVSSIYSAVSSELEEVSSSHLELSKKLENQIASNLKEKVDHYKDVLEKWTLALEELFDDRQDSTLQLLKLQSKYMRERELTGGKSTPAYEALKNQYTEYEEEVNKLSQEWNEEWKNACKIMDTMEYRRFDILKDTLWEYADLTSEIMYIQNKWSEIIRIELDKYNVEEEIQNCISNHGTGSHVPTAKDYVVDVFNRRKQKKLQKQALGGEQKVTKERNYQEERNSPDKYHYQQRDSTDSIQEQPTRPASAASVYSDWSTTANNRGPPPPPPVDQPSEPMETEKAMRIRKIISDNKGSTAQRGQIKRKPLSKSFIDHASSNSRVGTVTKKNAESERKMQDATTNPPAPTAQSMQKNFDINDSLESMLRNFENPSAIAEEREPSSNAPRPSYEYKPDTGSISNRRSYINNNSNQEPQRVERPEPPAAPQKKNNQNTHVLQEIERPGAQLKSVSKGNNYLRKSQELDQSTKSGSQSDRFTNGAIPAVPPKSPRPSPRPSAQILPEKSQSTSYSQNQASPYQNNDSKQQPFLQQQQQQQQPYYNHQNNSQQNVPPPSPLNQHHPSPMMHNQYVPHGHAQQQQQQRQHSISYSGQPHMQQQQQPQHTLVPQNPYSYSGQVAPQSPMMHPQRSPSMQPQPSPTIYPQRSPMMQPQPSPQPQHYSQNLTSLQLTPVMQPSSSVQQYGTLRGGPSLPPLTIPNGNYTCSPVPSPSMAYAAAAAPISPAATLPPSQGYISNQSYASEVPRPTQYMDGTPILFWATSHHSHVSQAEGGLCFAAGTMVAVFNEKDEWWTGATWDPQTNAWSNPGVAPNGAMYKI